MIRQLAAVLLHRDHDLDLPECGIADGFVLSRSHLDDLPCRDTATRRAVFRCPTHGLRTRDVCDHHELVLAKDLGACEVCEQAGETVPVEFVQSGPVLRPQPETTTAKESQ